MRENSVGQLQCPLLIILAPVRSKMPVNYLLRHPPAECSDILERVVEVKPGKDAAQYTSSNQSAVLSNVWVCTSSLNAVLSSTMRTLRVPKKYSTRARGNARNTPVGCRILRMVGSCANSSSGPQ
jgi:hypothetical protein